MTTIEFVLGLVLTCIIGCLFVAYGVLSYYQFRLWRELRHGLLCHLREQLGQGRDVEDEPRSSPD